jgi:plasmid stabilization system protein ParE
MSHEVHLSRRAERDLDQILAWISRRSQQGVRSWLERWDEVREVLSLRPESCLLAPESEDHDEEIRHVVFKTKNGRKYRVLFLIRGQQVFVTNLRGPGQDLVPPDQLNHSTDD